MKIVLAAYGSRGDVEPCVAVARELLSRGHEVRLAVPPDKLDFAAAAGLVAAAYGPDTRERIDLATRFVQHGPNPMDVLPQLAEDASSVWSEKNTALTALVDGADLVVAGMNEQRLVANVAERYEVPLAALHFFPAEALELGGLQSHITNIAAGAQRILLGLPEEPEPARDRALEIQAYEEFCVPKLAAEWAASGLRRPFVGSLTLEMPTAADAEVLSWIGDGPPPLYFGFGSTPVTSPAETVAVISAACARLDERALICSGPNDFTDAEQPAHVKIVDAVNHATVFPACRLVVHHGGSGTTAAAMRAGVPMLILWLWLDQPIWADSIHQLEIGIGRPFSASTLDTLVADLRAVLAPHYRDRARDVGARMTPPGASLAAAADLLEAAAESG